MLDLHFFRNRRFTGAVAGAVLIAFGMAGSLFLLTQHLQFVLGYGPLEAGLRTAPLALAIVALNFTGLSARWTARLGTPVSIGLGMVLMSAGLVADRLAGRPRAIAGTLLGLLLIGAGGAVASPAMAHAIMSAIPAEKAGVGAGVNGTVAEFGQRVWGSRCSGRCSTPGSRRGFPSPRPRCPQPLRPRGRRGRRDVSATRSPPGWRPVCWWGRWPCCSVGCWRRRCCAGRSGQTRRSGGGAR